MERIVQLLRGLNEERVVVAGRGERTIKRREEEDVTHIESVVCGIRLDGGGPSLGGRDDRRTWWCH